jgi:hypothetical protein
VRSGDRAALLSYFEQLVDDLRPLLTKRHHGDPPGSIMVRSPVPVAVRLDGRFLAQLEPGDTIVEHVAPGRRSVVLSGDAEQTFAVVIEPGRTATVSYAIATRRSHAVEWTMIGAGAASIAGGIAGAIVAATRAGEVRSGCFVRAETECEPGRVITTGFDPDLLPTTDPDTAYRGGVALIPLAAALLAGGAIWISGALLFFDEERLPLWLTVAAGLVVGFAAYGIGLAAN